MIILQTRGAKIYKLLMFARK